MTEEEAKAKACCGGQGCGRKTVDGERFCIGSACMAWRESAETVEDLIVAIRRHREEYSSGLKEAKDYVESHPEYRKHFGPKAGWCGLAGKP